MSAREPGDPFRFLQVALGQLHDALELAEAAIASHADPADAATHGDLQEIDRARQIAQDLERYCMALTGTDGGPGASTVTRAAEGLRLEALRDTAGVTRSRVGPEPGEPLLF
ncbi:hypothetical protein [Jannaschia ovalis]|uniref:Uncharacterized protein n=1 Tax=Jannaschia ovalis TaxID=3038773 RepID=A0ABY8LFS1_9RHOB|nr:hypothetical protein [Jannaschia sp. GRR-S6-38]WGH80138.1 hypothetical protein P8627_07695 [Jannaschia sp. GRR-S6-38]